MSQTTHQENCMGKQGTLYLALELGWSQWKLTFTTEVGEKPRLRTVKARELQGLLEEIGRAKERFGLPSSARVVSCYEAGRDGFWLHRYLLSVGVENRVVDSSSIEVNRRSRRAKTDRLDGLKLAGLLLRYEAGERGVWSVVRVPSVSEEDTRQLGRDLESLKAERTRHRNRLRGLLAAQGLAMGSGRRGFRRWLAEARLWNGSDLPSGLRARLEREFDRLEFLERQIREVEKQRQGLVAEPSGEKAAQQAGQLLLLKAIGINSAWLFATEFFGWRQFRNRRQVGSLSGLTPTPYQSGDRLQREQGISRAGNSRVRAMAIEIAWGWLRWQPDSQLSQWYWERFGHGNSRSRRVGIVALARKLLVALWRYLETGMLPEGARLKVA